MDEARRRWVSLQGQLGVHMDGILDDLITRHSEPHRAYHTLEHVLDVLGVFDGLSVLDRSAAELAAWFHDAVYDAGSSENEAQSARLAREALRAFVDEARLRRVEELILATARHEGASGADTASFLDADLAILGASPERYDAYARAIRAEFAWLPAEVSREGRSRVLHSFLDRPFVYGTPLMREHHEVAARENMQRELASLSAQTVQ